MFSFYFSDYDFITNGQFRKKYYLDKWRSYISTLYSIYMWWNNGPVLIVKIHHISYHLMICKVALLKLHKLNHVPHSMKCCENLLITVMQLVRNLQISQQPPAQSPERATSIPRVTTWDSWVRERRRRRRRIDFPLVWCRITLRTWPQSTSSPWCWPGKTSKDLSSWTLFSHASKKLHVSPRGKILRLN